MAVETAAAFLELLEKSKILKGDSLAAAREAAAGAADAKALARTLMQKELLTRWQAAQLLAGRVAFMLGKYRLVDLLGRGGMGSVFLAWHTMMNRSVALKIISRELGQDKAALERFFTEARAVAALDHPNIVHAYDVSNEGERYYMVMEYVEGRDLQRMVEAKGPLDFAAAVDYMRQAAEGLAHAHAKDMIHCDIKPANLLVNPQGVVKILDMGMARAVGRKPQSEPAEGTSPDDQAVLGTVDYMPPENALGIEKLDRRSDIYSLGCTFYFTLTGQAPFPEGTLAERILKHQTQEPKDLAETRPDTPQELIRICRKMMAKEPLDRFQTADELAQVLADWRPAPMKVLRATPLAEGEEDEIEAESAAEASPVGEEGKQPLVAALMSRAKGFLEYVTADRRRMMIWGGASGAAVLLLVCGLMWWIVSSVRGAKQQYAAQQAAAAAKTTAKPKRVSDGNFGELTPFWEESADGGGGAEKASPTPAPSGPPPKPVGPPPKPGGPPPKPGAPPPKPGVAPASPVATAPPAAPKPAAPEAKSTPDAKTAPAPAPATPPAPAPKTAMTPAPAPAPKVAPAPAPAAPAAPPGGDAFAGFPTFIDLPPIGEANASEFGAGPTLIGKVHGPLDSPVTIELIGKDTALKGKRHFVLEQKEGNEKKQTWAVRMESAGKEDAPTEVARLTRDKDGLKFQWSEGAAAGMGDYLRNCALDLRGGGPTHVVALRKAEIVDPVLFDMQKGITVGTCPIEFLPDAAHVRIELTKVEGPTGPIKIEHLEGPVFRPSNTAAMKAQTGLVFSRKDLRGHQMPGVEFTVQAVPKGKGLAISIRLATPSAQQYKGLRSAVAAGRQEAELKIRGVPQQFAAAKEEGEKAKIATEYEKWSAPLWYDQFYNQVHRNARLHFRVFIEAKDQSIELARTEAPK